MKKTVLIASSKGPLPGHEMEFLLSVRDCVEADSPDRFTKVLAGLVTQGPGCANYAFVIQAAELQTIEDIAHDLTMIMMPAKWTYTEDEIPEGFTNRLQ